MDLSAQNRNCWSSTAKQLLSLARNNVAQQIFILAVILVLMIIRQPVRFVEPRFWCEEGAVFFSYAFHHNWIETLLMPYIGYYSLLNNLVSAIAVLFPLEYAPFVTIYTSLIVQIIPCAIVIFGNSPFWDTFAKKLIIAVGITILTFDRMWLTSTYIHFNLAVITFLILLENSDVQKTSSKYFYRSLLVIAGLTGTVSCFLTPVYFLKALRTKGKESLIQTIILSLSSLVQIAVLVSLYLRADPSLNTRFVKFGIEGLTNIINFQFITPFLGRGLLEHNFFAEINKSFYMYTLPRFGVSSLSWPPLSEMIVGSTIFIFFVYLFIRSWNLKGKQLIIYSFLLVFVLSSVSSVHMAGGPRYAYAPSVTLLIFLVAELYSDQVNRWKRGLVGILITLMLFFNLYEFREGMDYAGPNWKEQVGLWRQYNGYGYSLKIWPYFGNEKWEMQL